MDGGAWWAAVHGVAKSWTRLSDFTFTFPFHALEKEMATHSSVLAWRIPGTGEPGGLPSMGSHRVRHDWSDLAAAACICVYIIFFFLKPIIAFSAHCMFLFHLIHFGDYTIWESWATLFFFSLKVRHRSHAVRFSALRAHPLLLDIGSCAAVTTVCRQSIQETPLLNVARALA